MISRIDQMERIASCYFTLNFYLESFRSKYSCHNKITLKIILRSIPHQKFCFYHLPTRGRAGIKLGDAWYVSNISIIFDCSMLLYYIFWMSMGFILHFYIIFGTNLLTGGPTQIAVFAYFRVLKKRNIKRSPNGMKPSGTWFSQQTWSRRLGVGPSLLHRPSASSYIYPRTPQTSRSTMKT